MINKNYNELINTGVKWLPEINSKWKIGRVKDLFYISKELSTKNNPIILSLARSAVKVRDISNNEGQLAASYDNYNSVRVGDLLLNPMDLYSGANCNVSYVDGVISPAYSNLRTKIQLEPKYYDYYFKTQYWTMAMFTHGKGVSFDNRWTLNNDALLNYEVPIVPFNEQQKIVDILNKKVSQIDALILNQENQIEKLKEYKQSLITKSVTTGLNQNIEMKDSGIYWLNSIPINWNISKLKYLYDNRNEKYIDGDYEYIALENIESMSGKYIYTETNKNYLLDGSICANKDDVIFGKLRPYLAKSFLVEKKSFVSSEFAVFFSKENSTKFLKYVFLSSVFIDVINSSTYGTKMPRANIDFINNLKIAIPNIFEQNEIANYLDEKCYKIDKLIEIKQSKIEKLQEYKKSMIYEYVTGKKLVD